METIPFILFILVWIFLYKYLVNKKQKGKIVSHLFGFAFAFLFMILTILIIIEKESRITNIIFLIVLSGLLILTLKRIKKKEIIEKKENYNHIDNVSSPNIIYPENTPIEIIESYERASFDEMRFHLQKIAYSMVGKNVSESEKNEFKKIMTYFANRDPLYKEVVVQLLPIISKNEGIIQSSIYSFVPNYSVEQLRYVLYFAHELRDITRIKKGRSYQLFTPTFNDIKVLN